MTKRSQPHKQSADETAKLKSRLEETEETLRAIRQYMVDAFVVTRADGEQVVTLNEADFPYRMMVESMNEGAATLIPDGSIFYCNPRFGEMVHLGSEKLIGVPFRDLIVPEDQDAFDLIFKEAEQNGRRGEFCLRSTKGKCVPVQLSIYHLATDSAHNISGISIIATDISERVQAEAKIRSLASKLTLVEQEERLRISQVLHDDLQQRLFAMKAQLSFLKDIDKQDQLSADVYVELDQIQASLSEAIAITRNLSIDLSPVVLHGEGLAEAMTWLSFRMREQYGLQIDLESREDFSQLDHHMRILLFQSIRELLFNVVKHAGVLEAKVTLEQTDRGGRITISDEGKGFDAGAVLKDPKTHGLLIVRDRLNLLGCRMEVISKPGEGTRVVIEIPIERAEA
ncbi:MAG TPA: PAS domain-containing sensor histidine kinase [Anaerolineales bacterium]|nr:PAS domain-containing sensor histidine kinase [Anaerolineales bacterium]